MHKISAAVATFALAAGSVVTGAAPASADTPGCVTKREFGRVAKGWSKGRVHRVFDTRGKQTAFFGATAYTNAEQWREYRACRNPEWSSIEVDYEKRSGVWRVTNKYAYWG